MRRERGASRRSAAGALLLAAGSAAAVVLWLARSDRRRDLESALAPAEEPADVGDATPLRSSVPDDASPASAPGLPDAPEPAVESAAAEDALPELRRRLDALTETYRGEHPDHAGLLAWWEEAAALATIDPASVRTENGVTHGSFVVGPAGGEGTFQAQPDGGVSVHLVHLQGDFVAEGMDVRMMGLGFAGGGGERGTPWMNVHFHPVLSDAGAEAAGLVGSNAGWMLTFRSGQPMAVPQVFQRPGDGARLTARRGLERNVFQPGVTAAAHDAWWRLLQPHCAKSW